MMPSEAMVLLATIARVDKRTASETEAKAWAEAMTRKNVNLKDAIEAVQEHTATSTEYITPAHIVAKAKEISRARWVKAGDPPVPGGLTYHQEKEFRRIWCDHVKDGQTPMQAGLLAIEELGIPAELPPVPAATAKERAALIQRLANSKAIPRGAK